MLASVLHNDCSVPLFLDIVRDPNLCISYSQFGEDTLIVEWFAEAYRTGREFSNIYVDIGAYHPSRFSNTKLLSMMGWRGINVDPNPASIELFQAQRPQDTNLNLGVAAARKTADLYCFQEGAFNTLSQARAEELAAQGWEVIARQTVELLPINQLLEMYLPEEAKMSGLGFLDIDCEGLDREIILSFDVARFRPYIIAIEAHDFAPLQPTNHDVVQFLLKADYELVAYTGPTLLFKQI